MYVSTAFTHHPDLCDAAEAYLQFVPTIPPILAFLLVST
jgi:hypothetical protein